MSAAIDGMVGALDVYNLRSDVLGLVPKGCAF